MDPFFAVGTIVVLILFIAVGNYAGKRVKDRSDYYVYGRQAPTLLVVGSLVASYLSTVAFMGEAGFAYAGYLVPLLTLGIMSGLGYVVGSIFFGRFLRRSETMTIPQYFGERFNSQTLRAITAMITVLGIGAYLVAVNQGLGLIAEQIFDIPYLVGVAVAVLVYGSFTFWAGSRGVLITDTIMFLMFTLAGVLIAPFVFREIGGWQTGLERLGQLAERPNSLDWGGITGPDAFWATQTEAVIWALVLGVVWFLVVGTSPWQVSRYQMARNEHTVVRSGLVAMMAFAILYVIVQTAAAAAAVIDPDISPAERVLIVLATDHGVFPAWLGLGLVVGILSAGLSSCSTFLSLVGFSVSHDILPMIRERWGRGERESADPGRERQAIWVARFSMLGIALIAFLLTISPAPAILWIAYFAATLFASSWGVLAFLSIHWRRVTRVGAIAGVIVGAGSLSILQAFVTYGGLTLPFWMEPALVGIVGSALAVIIGSLLSRPSPAELTYRDNLVRPTAVSLERSPRREYVLSRNIAFGAIALAVVLVVALELWYYRAFAAIQ
jgi:Na+/proline symporter